jgi:hypothetical protein
MSRARWGKTPPEADFRRAAGDAGDPRLGIERFLLEWELEQGQPTADALQIMGYADQGDLDPPPDDPAFVMLLPTVRPWEVYSHVQGLWNRPSDRLVRAARQWNERFGAECVAIYPGYSTQLLVQRPPADIWTAWELAREHWLLAPDTIMLPGIHVRDYARALMEARYWELKSKP